MSSMIVQPTGHGKEAPMLSWLESSRKLQQTRDGRWSQLARHSCPAQGWWRWRKIRNGDDVRQARPADRQSAEWHAFGSICKRITVPNMNMNMNMNAEGRMQDDEDRSTIWAYVGIYTEYRVLQRLFRCTEYLSYLILMWTHGVVWSIMWYNINNVSDVDPVILHDRLFRFNTTLRRTTFLFLPPADTDNGITIDRANGQRLRLRLADWSMILTL